MAVLSIITTFSLLLFIIMSFIPHSIVFDVIVITIAAISSILFGTSVIAIKNKRFKKWLSKKFYF
jgi:NADH:ubiquinone oxidoreductase subunit 4 (subunit M)